MKGNHLFAAVDCSNGETATELFFTCLGDGAYGRSRRSPRLDDVFQAHFVQNAIQ